MITIIDYGVGNLFSLSSSLSYLGLENKVSRDPEDLRNSVGAPTRTLKSGSHHFTGRRRVW